MGLLDKLKEKQEKESIVHPLKEDSFETRTNYLTSVAYFIVIDGNVEDKEKEKFIILIDILECEDLKEDLLEFLQEPNIDEFDEIFEYLGMMKFGYYYLVEVLHLRDALLFSKAESEFIELILQKIGVDKDALELIESFYQQNSDSQKKGNTLASISKIENLQNSMHKMAQYLKIEDPYVLFWANSLDSASSTQRDDKEIVLEAVKQNGWVLKFASERIQDDKEIVLEAVKQNGYALEYASERLKDDKEIVLEAVKQNGWVLKFASERIQDDKEIVLEAVKQNGWALKYASERLQDDKEIKDLCNQINK